MELGGSSAKLKPAYSPLLESRDWLEDMVSLKVEPEAVDLLLLLLVRVFRTAKGWALGARLTGSGVTVHRKGASSVAGHSQVFSGGDRQISPTISLMISSSGPHGGNICPCVGFRCKSRRRIDLRDFFLM